LADKKVAEYPLKFNVTSEHAPIRIGALGPECDSYTVIPFPLTENELQEMSNDRSAIYLFGLIEYKVRSADGIGPPIDSLAAANPPLAQMDSLPSTQLAMIQMGVQSGDRASSDAPFTPGRPPSSPRRRGC
jgi:hypothetical protein